MSTVTQTTAAEPRAKQPLFPAGSRRLKYGLWAFVLIVVAHWSEHIAQAWQLWVLHWTLKQSRGVLGLPFPWLITTEWLHYAFAVVMLVGLILLRHGFTGSARRWWGLALKIQIWHHFEHLLLLIQALSHHNFFGASVPTSIIQLIAPRVELHLFYNTVVTIPMVVAMVVQMRSDRREVATATQ
jgi:hypothetical protein